MQQALLKAIRNVVPFTEEEASLIIPFFVEKNYKRNEILIPSGKVANHVFFVVKGLLQQYYIDELGNEKTCDFIFENNFATDLESFTQKTPSSSSVKALKETICLGITCSNLMQVIRESKSVENYFNSVIEQIAAKSMRRTKSLLTNSPEQRFLELLELQPDVFQKIPQRYIAQYLGVAPESLSRIKKRIMVAAKS